MSDETGTSGIDRRSIIKKAGVAGAAIWAAPVVTSLSSPAFADGSPSPGPGDDGSLCPITVDVAGTNVHVDVAAQACNTLQFGIDGLGLVCDDCAGSFVGTASHDFPGQYPVGYSLVGYLLDRGNLNGECCGNTTRDCNARFDCSTRSDHVLTVRNGPNDYTLYFTDDGCGCAGGGTNPTSVNRNLEAHITIS